MFRIMLSVLCLFAVAGLVAAAEKPDKAGTTVEGKFTAWKNGALTIAVGKPGEEKEMTFKVIDDTKVTLRDGADKKEVLAKVAFLTLKPDTPVIVMLDADKQVKAIIVDLKK